DLLRRRSRVRMDSEPAEAGRASILGSPRGEHPEGRAPPEEVPRRPAVARPVDARIVYGERRRDGRRDLGTLARARRVALAADDLLWREEAPRAAVRLARLGRDA